MPEHPPTRSQFLSSCYSHYWSLGCFLPPSSSHPAVFARGFLLRLVFRAGHLFLAQTLPRSLKFLFWDFWGQIHGEIWVQRARRRFCRILSFWWRWWTWVWFRFVWRRWWFHGFVRGGRVFLGRFLWFGSGILRLRIWVFCSRFRVNLIFLRVIHILPLKFLNSFCISQFNQSANSAPQWSQKSSSHNPQPPHLRCPPSSTPQAPYTYSQMHLLTPFPSLVLARVSKFSARMMIDHRFSHQFPLTAASPVLNSPPLAFSSVCFRPSSLVPQTLKKWTSRQRAWSLVQYIRSCLFGSSLLSCLAAAESACCLKMECASLPSRSSCWCSYPGRTSWSWSSSPLRDDHQMHLSSSLIQTLRGQPGRVC